MDKSRLAELKKTKTAEQVKVIEYFDPVAKSPLGLVIGGFFLGGIIGGVTQIEALMFILAIAGAVGAYFLYKKGVGVPMTDEEYEAIVQSKIADSKKMALSKIGLDEDEVKEIDPVSFEGYWLKGDILVRKTKNETCVSSNFVKTWLFFSNTQIYIWVFDFHLDKDSKKEDTQEFFYKDVTSLSTSTESEKTKFYIPPEGCSFTAKEGTTKEQEVSATRFTLVVPGDKISVPMKNTDENNNRVQAMKQKLREKKQG